MEHQSIDRLFQEGLAQPVTFSRAEEQWTAIEAQLRPPKRRRLAWWWSGLLLLALAAVGYGSFQLAAKGKQPNTPTDVATSGTSSKQATLPLIEANGAHSSETSPAPLPEATLLPPAKTKRSATTIPANEQPQKTPAIASAQPQKSQTYDTAITPATAANVTRMDSLAWLSPLVPRLTIHPIREEPVQATTTAPAPISATRKSWSFLAGGTYPWQSHPDVVQSSSIHPYLGLKIDLNARWSLAMRYSRGDMEHAIQGTPPADYNITFDNTYAPEPPDSSGLQYQRQALDLQLAFAPLRRQKWQMELLGGGQFSRTSPIQAQYIFQGVYTNLIVDEDRPAQSWQGSSLFAGANIKIPLSRVIALESQYQYHFPINPNNPDWPQQQQLNVGLQFKF